MKNLTAFLILLAFPVLGAQTAEVEYYTGGNSIIKLSPVPLTNGNTVTLKGTVKYPNILLHVQKTGSARQRKYMVNIRGNALDCRVLMKDGAGKYTFTFFGSPSLSRGNVNYDGLCAFDVVIRSNRAKAPPEQELNALVVAEAQKYSGKTVGRGECWDLAQQILDDIGADWQRPTTFGRRIDWTKEEVKPGDIMQMYSLVLVEGNRTETYGLPQHTAIVEKVIAPGVYGLLHQNAGGKRIVTRSAFKMKNIQRGTLEVYRPVAGIVYPSGR